MDNLTSSSSSSDQSEDELISDCDEVDNIEITTRKKRDIAWCGVDTEEASSSTNIAWPPEPEQVNAQTWPNLRPNKFGGNPNPFGNKLQFFSRTDHFLAIYPDRKVRGTQDRSDLHTHLEILDAGDAGLVRIKGSLTNLYLAMNKKGRIYGEVINNNTHETPIDPLISRDNTIFIERVRGQYNTYLSHHFAHNGWYLAIKITGKIKNGKKTAPNQKAIQFLPSRKKFNE